MFSKGNYRPSTHGFPEKVKKVGKEIVHGTRSTSSGQRLCRTETAHQAARLTGAAVRLLYLQDSVHAASVSSQYRLPRRFQALLVLTAQRSLSGFCFCPDRVHWT